MIASAAITPSHVAALSHGLAAIPWEALKMLGPLGNTLRHGIFRNPLSVDLDVIAFY
jgi:hypothetical protein